MIARREDESNLARPPRSTDGDIRRLGHAALPIGPPLHLETPGRVSALLSPFVLPERLARLQGVVAKRTRHLTLLLDGVHDAHNIAACIRTCDAFGLQDLHIIPSENKPLKMSRLVASGADRWVSVKLHDDVESACAALSQAGYQLAVTHIHGAGPLRTPADVDIDAPLAIAFGNERDGVSAALRAKADLLLHIPMSGFVESLNISVAVAIAVSRVRERFESEAGCQWRLSELEQRNLLDAWVLEDVPHAEAVLEEISKRQNSGLSGGDGSV